MLHDLFQKSRPAPAETPETPETPETAIANAETIPEPLARANSGAAAPEACQNCEFWFRYAGSKRGSCRRYPPSAAITDPIDPSRLIPGHFPQTREDLWCGEYQPRPE